MSGIFIGIMVGVMLLVLWGVMGYFYFRGDTEDWLKGIWEEVLEEDRADELDFEGGEKEEE